MRVCMVAHHGCIRVFKLALALIEKGHTVDIITNQPPFGHNMFATMSIYFDAEQLTRCVQASPADVFHIHNTPDWLVSATRAGTDKPIVYDIHDLESLRRQQEPEQDENDAFRISDAWVHVSQACKDAAYKYHGNGKPSIVLHSYVNERFVGNNETAPSWSSVVYEGGVSSQAQEERLGNGLRQVNMRYFVPLADALSNQGYEFFIFGVSPLGDMFYENAGAVYFSGLMYPVLMRALRPFAYGFVGALIDMPLMQAAMPNKLFEYISQGVVPIIYKADEAAGWAQEMGVGIKLESLNDLGKQLEQAPAIRENILKRRHEFTMERNIQPLIDLYEELI